MGASSIEWTDATWNPVTGCTRVSEGCRNCYAFDIHDMRHAAYQAGKDVPEQYAKPFTELQTFPERLTQPLHWKKPRMVFVNSMSDLFHDDVPDGFIADVFRVMGQCKQHTFQVLTKRPERMQRWMREQTNAHAIRMLGDPEFCVQWPYPNVWLGVSVEDQRRADERIPHLLNTPAAVRFLSCEPLLGPLDLRKHVPGWRRCAECRRILRMPKVGQPTCDHCGSFGRYGSVGFSLLHGIHWIIVGGESGDHARPMHPDWARSICNQCQSAGVPFFFKQWGAWKPISEMPETEYGPLYDPPPEDNPEAVRDCRVATHMLQFDGKRGAYAIDGHLGYQVFRVGKKKAGRQLDGREWNEFPEVGHVATA